MKKFLAAAAALLLIVSLSGCIVIEQGGNSTETPGTKETEAPTQAPETQAPETQAPETQAPETQAPETQAPETQAPETQGETGKTVQWADEPQASDNMRYPYSWLAGLYHGETKEDGNTVSADILFYENGLFSAEEKYTDYHAGSIGSYVIDGDTIHLHVWFTTGGGPGASATSADLVMGINMDRSLISGEFFKPNVAMFPVTGKSYDMFASEHAFEKTLKDQPLINDFFMDYPDQVKMLLP